MKDLSSCSIMTIDQMAGDRCEHQTRHAGPQQHEVNHARLDEGECDTLLLIDPDHFSLINDKTRIFQKWPGFGSNCKGAWSGLFLSREKRVN
ncbi:hypothetical protein NKH56_33255 [Mesorhizobium sp. M1076]|uniref:hypothetical protein n=1 Tax=Mesorhizobium sp. M1076 TaxID=2957054 RepID=UPI00333A251C